MNNTKTLEVFLIEIEESVVLQEDIRAQKFKELIRKWIKIVEKLCSDDCVESFRSLSHLRLMIQWVEKESSSRKKK